MRKIQFNINKKMFEGQFKALEIHFESIIQNITRGI